MKVPHFLKWLKYRVEFYRNYVARFGLAEARRLLRETSAAPKAGSTELIEARVPGFPAPFFLRPGTSDISTFEKMFVWREYAAMGSGDAEIVVDCGGNIGLSAAWFAHAFPRARIFVLEPDPENFALLQRNTAAFRQVVPIQRAVWNKACRVRLENPGAKFDSLRFQETTGTDGVDAWDLATLLREHDLSRIDLLKIDIEGAENAVFAENYEPWLALTQKLVIECHSDEARAIVEKALSRFRWRKFRAGENDCFVRE